MEKCNLSFQETLCNGTPDCSESGSDEWGCLGLEEDVLMVGPDHLPVCWEGWTEAAGEAACHQLGFAGLLSAEFHQLPKEEGPWWLWKGGDGDDRASDWLQAHGEEGACESGAAVRLQCAPHTCGGWGGVNTVPSLALLFHVETRSSCPASLISATHLLASSSCLQTPTLDPKQWVVFPGLAANRQINVVAAITKIAKVVLLRMASPATLSQSSQPACLPSASATLDATPENCVIASWSIPDKGEVSFTQHKAPISLLSKGCPPNSVCTHPLSSPTPLPGSPLLCSKPGGNWTLHGLLKGPR